jgi:hypothetical protein
LDEALSEGRTASGNATTGWEDLIEAQALHSVPERLAVDLVAIAEKAGRRRVARKGVHDRLGRPVCSVMLKCRTRRRGWARTTRTKSTRKHAAGTATKSRETRSRTWLARKVRPVWDGGVCHMLGREFRAARRRLFQDGMEHVRARG